MANVTAFVLYSLNLKLFDKRPELVCETCFPWFLSDSRF